MVAAFSDTGGGGGGGGEPADDGAGAIGAIEAVCGAVCGIAGGAMLPGAEGAAECDDPGGAVTVADEFTGAEGPEREDPDGGVAEDDAAEDDVGDDGVADGPGADEGSMV